MSLLKCRCLINGGSSYVWTHNFLVVSIMPKPLDWGSRRGLNCSSWVTENQISFDDETTIRLIKKVAFSISGCGSVGRVVASNSRGLRFESSHRQKSILNVFTVNCIEKTKIKKKRPMIAHLFKKVVFYPRNLDSIWGSSGRSCRSRVSNFCLKEYLPPTKRSRNTLPELEPSQEKILFCK